MRVFHALLSSADHSVSENDVGAKSDVRQTDPSMKKRLECLECLFLPSQAEPGLHCLFSSAECSMR